MTEQNNHPKNIRAPLSRLTSYAEDFLQRGRKRRRSSDGILKPPTAHNPSGGSTTLRGRARRRSTSDVSARTGSGSGSQHRTNTVSPLGMKRQQKPPRTSSKPKKRSQSPSRSRSGQRNVTPPRRRQRTASRSRKHGTDEEAKDSVAEELVDGMNVSAVVERIRSGRGTNVFKDNVIHVQSN